MQGYTAEQQKTFNAEKQIAIVRSIVILFGTATFLFLENPFIKHQLAYCLLVLIWLYGAYILFFKPYEKYPIFLASWFTYIGDCIFATIWIYATGGYYSPYHVMLYTSIIAVAFRFNLQTTLFTSSLYTLGYLGLLLYMGQLNGHLDNALVRAGFIFIIGYMTNLITKETLAQTEQKIEMQMLAEEAKTANEMLVESQKQLAEMNQTLQLQNNIFKHAEENSSIGSFSWHLHSQEIHYSDNLFRILGYEPDEFTPSLIKFASFIHPDDKQKLNQRIETHSNGEAMAPNIYRVFNKTGQLRYLRSTSKYIDRDKERMMIGTLQDITEDVLLHQELKSKNSELEMANHHLASFNYIASHDLQEPVRKIQVFKNLILEKDQKNLTEFTKKYLERIAVSADRMQALIQSFLNYSRIGNTEVVFQETDLNQLVNNVKQNLHDIIAEKNAVIECDPLPVIPVEPVQFHQLFINLISNAIKYSRAGIDPDIRITAGKLSGKEINEPDVNASINYWKFSIRDNGIGFDTQYADKIFEVFQRLHTRDEYGGSGIGLAICKKVVLSHKGFINVNSKPGEGSTFNIYIPDLSDK
ncbi:MAG: putative two-component system sensor histidine kinase [Bacteroidota bacterium]|jgi:PAS domain S-box-containing protein|nr:putative two-component system sensor histidine kinase [Bacteroidota bacterium]